MNFLKKIFGEPSNMKFQENPSSAGHIVPRGVRDGRIWRSW